MGTIGSTDKGLLSLAENVFRISRNLENSGKIERSEKISEGRIE